MGPRRRSKGHTLQAGEGRSRQTEEDRPISIFLCKLRNKADALVRV